MIALDTNLLVHAHQKEAELHQRAKALVVRVAESLIPWAVCLHTLVEFYGVATNTKIWKAPSTPDQALDQIGAWRESPSLRILTDDTNMLPVLSDLLRSGNVRGGMVHDARIASCCLLSGVDELWTVDRDFSRFPSLKTRNPLL